MKTSFRFSFKWAQCSAFPIIYIKFNSFNAEATFIQRTKTKSFLKIIQKLSCWYPLESSRWELPDEYTYVPGFQSFSMFLHHLVLAKLATTSMRVKNMTLLSTLETVCHTEFYYMGCHLSCFSHIVTVEFSTEPTTRTDSHLTQLHNPYIIGLTLPMLRLLSSKSQECKYFWKTSKLCHVGVHSIAHT